MKFLTYEMFPTSLTLITYRFPTQLQISNGESLSMQQERGLHFSGFPLDCCDPTICYHWLTIADPLEIFQIFFSFQKIFHAKSFHSHISRQSSLEYVVLSHSSFQKFLPVLEFLTKYSNTIPPGQKGSKKCRCRRGRVRKDLQHHAWWQMLI